MTPIKPLSIILPALLLISCGATAIKPGAETVELINDKPDKSICRYIAEIIGTEGNRISGRFTPDSQLVIGARNNIRNQAFELGGNIVYVQSMINSGTSSHGTTNTTIVGKVYRCS